MDSYTSTTQGLPDINDSTLKLAETKKLIEEMVLNLSGFELVKKGTIYNKSRTTKPIFTQEFSKEVGTFLYLAINKVTGRTTFKDWDIKKLCLNFGSSFCEYLARKGFKSYVTDEIWKYSTKLCKNEAILKDLKTELELEDDLSKKALIIEDINSVKVYSDELKFNEDISDFTGEHADFIIKEYKLDKDRAGAKQVLKTIFWTTMTFFEGALRKSEQGLTLNYEKGILRETIQASSTASSNDTSTMSGVKNNLFGGNNAT